jgi:hypothetical protein
MESPPVASPLAQAHLMLSAVYAADAVFTDVRVCYRLLKHSFFLILVRDRTRKETTAAV